jgi:hypothetical protein
VDGDALLHDMDQLMSGKMRRRLRASGLETAVQHPVLDRDRSAHRRSRSEKHLVLQLELLNTLFLRGRKRDFLVPVLA